MERVTHILPAGQWPSSERRDIVRLTFEDRFRRRWRFTGIGGLSFLLDLPEARLLNDGDGLQLDSGSYVAVEAVSEPLLEVTATDADVLARIAWHLGNRHLPVQLGAGWLRLRADHVIEDLLRKLGASVQTLEAPFTPEGGGYSASASADAGHHGKHDKAALTTQAITAPLPIASQPNAALYRIMTWLSSSYPVGAFSYSHGIEYAVEAGLVRDRSSLTDWIATILRDGSGKVDGALFAAAWRAAKAGDAAELDRVAELAAAWRGTAEIALESSAQGTAFVAITTNAWLDAALATFAGRHGNKLAFPVAVAVAMAPHVQLGDALAAYLTAFAANLVGAGVRLIPLGQTDGQLAVAALEPIVMQAAAAAQTADLHELGTAAPMLDWCSMRHETQYTRLFRS
jgi:urease accessory protein